MLLSLVVNFCRNFAVRISICYVTGRKRKNFWHSSTTAADPVRNNFINERVTVNSSDRFHAQSKGTILRRIIIPANTWHEASLQMRVVWLC